MFGTVETTWLVGATNLLKLLIRDVKGLDQLENSPSNVVYLKLRVFDNLY